VVGGTNIRIYSYVPLVVLLLSLGLAPRTQAQDIPKYVGNGNSLYAICTAASGDTLTDTASEGMCLGYVYGVASTLDMLEYIDLPTGVTHGQLKDVVVKYLKDNPATRNQDAAVLTTRALSAVFSKKN
jgi:hypothetical protein